MKKSFVFVLLLCCLLATPVFAVIGFYIVAEIPGNLAYVAAALLCVLYFVLYRYISLSVKKQGGMLFKRLLFLYFIPISVYALAALVIKNINSNSGIIDLYHALMLFVMFIGSVLIVLIFMILELIFELISFAVKNKLNKKM